MKQLVYGLTYGMGASTLAKKMGCSLEKSRGYLEGLKTRFPGLVRRQHTCKLMRTEEPKKLASLLLQGLHQEAPTPVMSLSIGRSQQP